MTKSEAAIRYAEKGLHVFPLTPNWKTPLSGSHGFHDATTNINIIKKWWAKNPEYNIGIRCGIGFKVICLDVDKKKGKNGFPWMNAHEDLPVTAEQTTPSKGKQYIFSSPEEFLSSSADKITEGIDVRADSGYFVAPPSVIKKREGYDYEGTYEWVSDQSVLELELANAPEWLLDEIRATTNYEIEMDKESIEHSETLPISRVVDFYNIKLRANKNGCLYGAHPIHGSSNGMNFKVDTNLNCWACYRHTKPNGKFVGGGPLHLIAIMEGILDCAECMPKSLSGDRFNEVLKIVEIKFGISSDRFIKNSIDNVLSKIKETQKNTDFLLKVSSVKALLPDISKLKKSDQLICISLIKEIHKFKKDIMSSIQISLNELKKTKSDIKFIDFNNDGYPTATDTNLLQIFNNDEHLSGKFKKNTFTDRFELFEKPNWDYFTTEFPRNISDDDGNLIKNYIINKYNIEFKMFSIIEAIRTSCILNQYNPIKDYLDSLKWDGIPRLGTWMHDVAFVDDNRYTQWVSKLIICAAIKRIYEPGCKYDHVVTFSGDQGLLKSSLIEALAGGHKYFVEMSLSGKDKDNVQKMKEAWFIELAEGASLSIKEMKQFKAFVTTKKDVERFAYDRFMSDCKRKSIFIMTINPENIGYLKDETGLRRFLPIRIQKHININKLLEIRDQVFAEAKEELKNGFKIYIDKEDDFLIDLLNNEIEIAEIKDDWQDTIYRWISKGQYKYDEHYDSSNREYSPVMMDLPEVISCLFIWQYCFDGAVSKYNQYKEGRRIGAIMKKLGYEYTQEMKDGINNYGYNIKNRCPKKIVEEIGTIKWDD